MAGYINEFVNIGVMSDIIKLKLYEDDIYFTYWAGVRPQHRTSEEAWEDVERKCEALYGCGIFPSYEAFRSALHRYKAVNPVPVSGGSSMLTNVGYFDRYFEIKTNEMTVPDAYSIIEGEVYVKYGINLYSTFHSFERALQRYIKNIRNVSEKSILRLRKNQGQKG